MTTITLETTLELTTCCACGVSFAFPVSLMRKRMNDHQTFYCPNGHHLSFAQKSDVEKAQAETAKYKQLYKEEREYAAGVVGERNATQRSLSATKGVLTRTKNRIANGVCPCCHRTFAELQKHMASQHPEYETKEEESK